VCVEGVRGWHYWALNSGLELTLPLEPFHHPSRSITFINTIL
jgi:hypothetical protein